MVNFFHLLTDNIFSNYVIDMFDSMTDIANVKHSYFMINRYRKVSHLEINVFEKIIFVKNEKQFVKQANLSADFVMLHQLSSPTLSASPWHLLKLRRDITLIWSTIGCDIYSDINFLEIKKAVTLNLYKPHTRKYIYGVKNTTEFVKQLIRKIINGCLLKNIAYKKMLKRVNYISTVLPNEYELIKQNNKTNADFLHFKYISKVFMTAEIKKNELGDMVLLGNSATETNNHLDILKILDDIKFDTSRLLIPLNYGNKKYGNMINSYCQEKDMKAVVLLDFMDFDKYVALLNSCSYCIIGCVRQQAVGNIILMLLRGVKLFLYKDSVIFKYLISRGYYVFSIDDISSESFVFPLTMEQKKRNFNLISDEYDYAKFITGLKASIMSLVE